MRGNYRNPDELNALKEASSLAKVQEPSPEQTTQADWTGHSDTLERVD